MKAFGCSQTVKLMRLWIYTLREKLTDIRMSNSVENKKLKRYNKEYRLGDI